MTIPILVTAAAWLFQQPAPQPRAASVKGTVLNTLTARGIPGATVILRARDSEHGTSYADDTGADGRFRIDDVAPGEYTISADRPNFFPQPNGAPGAPMPRITVATGEQVAGVVVKLTPTGVISGRVLDQDGEPVIGLQVHAMEYANVGGKPQLRSVEQVQTKDKGEYRLFGLRPGAYRIQVSGRPMRTTSMQPTQVRGPSFSLGYATTFFPSAPDAANAALVELRAGAELSGFDITIRTIQAWYSVRAKYTGADGVAMSPQLRPVDRSAIGYGQNIVHANDTLEFTGVVPGSYVLWVTRVENEVRSYARRPVVVSDADVDVGTLDFLPAANLKGTVRTEGKPSLPLEGVRLSFQTEGPSLQSAPHAQIKADGSFELKNVMPDIYMVVLMSSPGFYLKSIRLGDEVSADLHVDLTRGEVGPLTLVLGADVGHIEGSVVLADGNPGAGVRVTLFPEGAQAGRTDLFKFGFTDDKGNYHLDRVPPGEYRLFAWQDVQAGGPQDPELRKKFEKQSVTVKLAPNGRETVPLTAIVTKPADPR